MSRDQADEPDELPRMLAQRIHAALRETPNPLRAEKEKQYLKSDLEHYGVPVPTVRSIVRSAARENGPLDRYAVLDAARSLWSVPVHESRLAAAVLLQVQAGRLAAGDVEVLEQMIREARTWALVDVLAGSVAGRLLIAHPELTGVFRRWGADPDQWVRRSGILAFLLALRDNSLFDRHFPVATEIADRVLDDPRFFVRKAIGWVLREASLRRPDEVFEWLVPRVSRASGVTVREAARRLPAAQREQLLTSYHAARAGGPAAGTARNR